MEDIFLAFSTLPVVAHKLKVSGHSIVCTIPAVFICRTRTQVYPHLSSYILLAIHEAVSLCLV